MLPCLKYFLIVSCSIILSGCANLPKKHPHTSSSSKKSYTAFGKTYTVKKPNKHYAEKGMASWYGKKFHKRRTSSGERYNMYQLTAAHKTVPFSTRLQVTNLKNGKKVIVRVNDRGPFVSNRVIDLSYAAAKKIGMVNQGLTKVKIEAV